MLDEVGRVDEADPITQSIRRFLAVGRGYLNFAEEEPNMLAAAFVLNGTPDQEPEDPNPWHVLAAALDELVVTGAMPRERRAGAETIAWSAVHGFAMLQAAHSFHVSGEPDPDAESLLNAIARSLDVGSPQRAGATPSTRH